MLKLIFNRLFAKTVDGILRKLTKTVSHLEALIVAEQANFDQKNQLAADLQKQALEHAAHAARATRIKGRIATLVE